MENILKLGDKSAIFAVYKPKGISSFGAVARVRRALQIKKVGHAGTLDPLACGVLVVAVGREATKQIDQQVKKEKEYLAIVRLGQTSTTDDEEGEKTINEVKVAPELEEVKEIIKGFIGEIEQVPPAFSAIKIGGRRAYKMARKGEEVIMASRPALIKEIEILSFAWPDLRLRVVTGPGVYIRALARDIGEALETGGYLADLERIRVGDFTKDQTISLEDFESGKVRIFDCL